MNLLKKKIMTGTVAASVLLGGGLVALLHNQVFAASADPSATTSTTTTEKHSPVNNEEHGNGKHRDFTRENTTSKEVAAILTMDQTMITNQLKQGKTLAQIAQDKGISENVLLQKLTDAENKNIDAAVNSGKITQTQADKQKSELAVRLKKEVENNEENGDHDKGRFGGFADPSAISQILGITEQEFSKDLKAGQSIVEIAQTKNITEEQLISKIKDSMTDKITKFVEKRDISEAKDTPAPIDTPPASSTGEPSN